MQALIAVAVLLSASFLMGCSQERVVIKPLPLPNYLLDCKDQVPQPAGKANDAFAQWVLENYKRGTDCHAKVEAIARLEKAQP